MLRPPIQTFFCAGRSLYDSNEAKWTPQEVRTREEVRLTLVKLDRPDSSWLDTKIGAVYGND